MDDTPLNQASYSVCWGFGNVVRWKSQFDFLINSSLKHTLEQVTEAYEPHNSVDFWWQWTPK
jgi:hypothetical protein